MIWWPCHFWPRSKRMQTSLGAPAHPTSPSCPSPIDLDRVFRPFSPVVTHLKTTASSLPSAACAANIACHRCLLQPSKPPRHRPGSPLPLSPSDSPWSPPMGGEHAGPATATSPTPPDHLGEPGFSPWSRPTFLHLTYAV
jgi:hypothetical protein